MAYPKLTFDLNKIKNNIDILGETLKKDNLSMMIVTKSFLADTKVTPVIDANPYVDYLADSRVRNLKRMENLSTPKVLLRVPQQSELEEMVKYVDISFQSEKETLKMTNEEAAKIGKVHKVVLMIDLGDLREGIFYMDKELIYKTIETILDADNLELFGMATNLTCYGAIIPKNDNLSILTDLVKEVEAKYDINIQMVSGGNSSSFYLIDKGEMPEGINNLRLGEAFILGNETAYSARIEGTYNDAVTLSAEIVELQTKPSLPIGEVGVDAFGEKPYYEDRGNIKRAILALGRQDADMDSMSPLDKKIEILGASSDHLIMDVTKSDKEYKVGDVITFTLGYGGLLSAATSEYVEKDYKHPFGEQVI